MKEEFYQVDLRDPVKLRSTLDAYLSLMVCPVESPQRPQLLFPATVEVLLPDGSSMTCLGTVIRYTDASGFLVQFDGPMELDNLEALAAPAADVSAARVAPAPPRPEPAPAPEPEPEPVYEADQFEGETTTLPGTFKGRKSEVTTAGGADPFADLLDDVPSGPGAEVEIEVGGGIPEGWSLTGDFDPPPPEKTVSDPPLPDVGEGIQDEDGAEEDHQPGAPRGNESELSDLYKHIGTLGPSEKQRLARSGNRVTRGLLVKDRMKNVHQFVFRNPKITIEEIIEYGKLPALSKDAVRIIASNRTWMASLQIVLALVRNPATPEDLLPGLLQRLGPAQWKVLAKGTVRPQVSSLAKRFLNAGGR